MHRVKIVLIALLVRPRTNLVPVHPKRTLSLEDQSCMGYYPEAAHWVGMDAHVAIPSVCELMIKITKSFTILVKCWPLLSFPSKVSIS